MIRGPLVRISPAIRSPVSVPITSSGDVDGTTPDTTNERGFKPPRADTPNGRILRLIASAWLPLGLSCILALVPIVRMARIVSSTGTNTTSNDYVLYSGFIERLLSGHYSWTNLLTDAFVVHAHYMLLPFLLRLAIIHLTNWNVYAELYVGLGLSLLKWIFTYLALTYLVKSRARYILLPTLAALMFSMTQVDSYTYGETALQLSLNQVGLAIGVWGLVRFRRRGIGVTIAVLGCLISTYSGAAGLPLLPIFLAGMVALGYRNIRHYIAYGAGGVAAAAPYLYFSLIHRLPWTGVESLGPWPHNHAHSNIDPLYFLSAIAYPFQQPYGLALHNRLALAGLLFTVVSLGIVLHRRVRSAAAVPGVLFLAYGYSNIALTTVFRGTMQSWYTTHFMPLWIGLAGLALVLWQKRWLSLASRICAASLSFLILTGWTVSNVSYPGRLIFLTTRVPASASCLRAYLTAPTYCEHFLFNWGEGRWPFVADLARPLDRHGLSVFAPQSQWTLQGDYALETVRVRHQSTDDVFWSTTRHPIPTPWYDFRHLNLFLRQGNALNWTLHLPGGIRRAWFTSVTDAASSAPHAQSGRVRVSVTISEIGTRVTRKLASRLVTPGQSWPLHVNLLPYAGHTVTIHFMAAPAGSSRVDWGIFQYPVIDVDNGTHPLHAWHEHLVSTPQPSRSDLRVALPNFDMSRGSDARVRTSPQGGLVIRAVGHHPLIPYGRPLAVRLASYEYLYVRAAATPTIWPRALYVYFRFSTGQSPYVFDPIPLPLYPGKGTHAYTFPLRLLDIPQDAKLTGITIGMTAHHVYTASQNMRILDLRFIADHGRGTWNS